MIAKQSGGKIMRINKEQLDALVRLPDDELWQKIRSMAGGYGVTLPSATPSHSEMMQLRSAVNGNKINLSEAMRLLNNYRKENKR